MGYWHRSLSGSDLSGEYTVVKHKHRCADELSHRRDNCQSVFSDKTSVSRRFDGYRMKLGVLEKPHSQVIQRLK